MQYTTIQESAKSQQGQHMESIVLETLDKGSRTEHVTHLKVYHPGQEPYTVSGNYYQDPKRAEKNYTDRCKELGVEPYP